MLKWTKADSLSRGGRGPGLPGEAGVGVERDPRMALVTARRLQLRRVRASLSDRRRAAR